jgi:hypothetical protein
VKGKHHAHISIVIINTMLPSPEPRRWCAGVHARMPNPVPTKSLKNGNHYLGIFFISYFPRSFPRFFAQPAVINRFGLDRWFGANVSYLLFLFRFFHSFPPFIS